MAKSTKIPAPTIERLALYSRPLEILQKRGTPLILSDELAERCGVSPAQVRKDLAYFGEFGIRGVGYDVKALFQEIKYILTTDRQWSLCIVGMGNLGKALAENENFEKRGYKFVAVFDSDPEKIGVSLACGLTIEPTTKIRELIQDLGIEIGIISTPPFEAQRVANLLIDSGIKAILNFAPTRIRTPENFAVENVDFTVKFENLVYHLGNLS